jgi:hypothetical protein
MSSIEEISLTEFDLVRDRFIDFVNSHTEESTSGLTGAYRDRKYDLIDPDQLIPIDNVEFEVFDTNPEEDPGQDYGYAIRFKYGVVERYSLWFNNGMFDNTSSDMDISTYPVDFNNVVPFIDNILKAEQAGRLIPSRT